MRGTDTRRGCFRRWVSGEIDERGESGCCRKGGLGFSTACRLATSSTTEGHQADTGTGSSANTGA